MLNVSIFYAFSRNYHLCGPLIFNMKRIAKINTILPKTLYSVFCAHLPLILQSVTMEEEEEEEDDMNEGKLF